MKKIVLIILVGMLSLGGSWLFSVYRGIPVPYGYDEFSYLLAADTFAHGRVTNPTHPMWEHFETFFVLQRPTYMSMYPPAQGFFMAMGQAVFGHPIYGVWLSAALMCMAICWMLYAWVPANWAFMGGVISVIEFGVFTYWSQSYWGGAVAAMGGALVFGALPRIFKYQRIRDVMWLGLGVSIIVNSRPLEGILMGLPVGCLILPWKIKWDTTRNFHFVKRIILPLILILSVIVTGLGAYNKAVTGKASYFPSILYQNNQMARPMLIWEPLRPMPVFRHQVLSSFIRERSNQYFLEKRTWKGFVTDEIDDIHNIFEFYFGHVLVVPVLCFLLMFLRNGKRALKFFLVILILACTCAVMPCPVRAHYFAPVTCLAVLLVVLGLRTLVILFKQRAMKLVYVLMAAQVLINILIGVESVNMESQGVLIQGRGDYQDYTREELRDMLTQKGGKHLVLVHEAQGYAFHNEWVYNGADIDKQPIVWARSMNNKKDAKLLAYYKDRQVWRIVVYNETEYSSGVINN